MAGRCYQYGMRTLSEREIEVVKRATRLGMTPKKIADTYDLPIDQVVLFAVTAAKRKPKDS